jgi:hypothetical protein
MPALTIMLIRHGEKPNDPGLGPGLTATGGEDAHSLVVRGWQRAGTWAALFGSGAFGADFPRPDAIYAANPSSPASNDDADAVSKRPFETILPLSQRLNVAPVTKYGVGDEAAMLDEVGRRAGVVLISWEHKKIAKVIAPALGQNLKWDGTRFDVVLRFDRDDSGGRWRFRQLFPQLLAGDSNVPLSTTM